MTQFSSGEAREFLEKYDDLMELVVQYVNIKYDTDYLTSDVGVIPFTVGYSQFGVAVFNENPSEDEDYWNDKIEYEIPFSIFDAWANVITQLKEQQAIKNAARAKIQENEDRKQYERLKARFEGK